jgi:hypothetical protein
MATITKKNIEQLYNIHSANCISIFIPTHRFGNEVLQKLDTKALKNELKNVKIKLQQNEVNANEIEVIVSPIQELIDNTGFWRKQSDGLAIFLAEGFFKTYTLPVNFKAYNYIANSFYLKPLMPMFVGDSSFYLLTLQLEDVKLYEMTKHSVTQIKINHLIPDRLEESVGYDFEEKGLQFRNQKEGYGTVTFHGHAESDYDRKNEIFKYFREINKGLMTILKDENSPMLISSQDYLFSIYKAINTYKPLLENHIPYDSLETDKRLLLEKAWETMGPIFDKERKEKIEHFKQYDGTNRTSSDIKEVLPAALQGKIDALFMRKDQDIFGIYDAVKHNVEIREDQESTHVSLLNMAAVKTFLQGGKVYLMEKDDMPNPFSKVNALYRF